MPRCILPCQPRTQSLNCWKILHPVLLLNKMMPGINQLPVRMQNMPLGALMRQMGHADDAAIHQLDVMLENFNYMKIQPHLEQKMRLNSSNSKPSRKLKMIRRLKTEMKLP